MARYKLAVLASHPVPYQSSIFRALHSRGDVDLMVYFASDFGINKDSLDPEFGFKIDWGSAALEGFPSAFLKNRSAKPGPSFWGQVNPAILRELAAKHYDAIWVNGWNSFTSWLVFLIAPFLGTKVFLRGENPWNQERLKRGLKQVLKRFALRSAFRRVSAFLYIGKENQEFYLRYGIPPRKLFFTPYSVDNDNFKAAAAKRAQDREGLRQRLGLSPQDVVFLFVGKLIEKKRPEDVLEAFSQAKVPAKKLILVGEGVLRQKLQEMVSQKRIEGVVFAGFQYPEALLDYYAVSDVLLLPSGMGETWGLVVNEAMCFGLAAIVSDLVGCGPDLVREGKNGYVVPFGDVKKIASAMESLGNDPDLMFQARQRSLEIVSGYAPAKDAEGIVAALRSFKQ